MFKKQPPQLYEKRWSVVADFLKVAWPQVLVLRHVWYDIFAGSNAQLTVDAKALQEALHSSLFLAYYQMALFFHAHLEEIPNWSEACSCHAWPHGEKNAMPLAVKEDFQEKTACPLANMRAPRTCGHANSPRGHGAHAWCWCHSKQQCFQAASRGRIEGDDGRVGSGSSGLLHCLPIPGSKCP